MGKEGKKRKKNKNPEMQTHSCFGISVHKDFYLKYGRPYLSVADLRATQVVQMLVPLMWHEGEKTSGTKGKGLENGKF